MKNSLGIKIAIIILIIFFGLKFLSEILFIKATSEEVNKDPDLLRLSSTIFPISSEVEFNLGVAMLNEYDNSGNEVQLEKSIERFTKSIKLNHLNFYSHFLLAKALMSKESGNPLEFEHALLSLKTAARIRPTNISINKEILKIYLSLWPFLNTKDKVWSGEVMSKLIMRINRSEFMKILEIWGLYSKDSGFLKYTFNNTGKFYKEIIQEMEKQELNLPLRQRFVAALENRLLEEYEIKFTEAKNRKAIPFSSYIRLSRNIKFYHKIAKGIKFKENKYINLKKEINFYIIKKLIEEDSGKNRKELFKYLNLFLDDFNLIRDLEDLELFLKSKNFFTSNDLRVFYIKQKINFKTGQVSKLIGETEKFRESVTFLKEKQGGDYTKLLSLLADAYINSRLLTKALEVLKDIDSISPGLLSTYWKLIKIESVIGEDNSFGSSKQEKYEFIRNSNMIMINNVSLRTKVYPYDTGSIYLDIVEVFKEKLRRFHLLQVFVNGKIFYEQYVGSIKFPVVLQIPDELIKSDFIVDVKLK